MLAATTHDIWFLPCSGAEATESRPLPERVQALPALLDKAWSGQWLHIVRAWKKLRTILADVRPALVHAGPVQSGALLAALARAHPLLVMSWGSDLLTVPDKNRYVRRLSRY